VRGPASAGDTVTCADQAPKVGHAEAERAWSVRGTGGGMYRPRAGISGNGLTPVRRLVAAGAYPGRPRNTTF